MVIIFWSELALEDLHSIFDFIAKDSRVYAQKFIDKLVLRVEQLEKFPNSGRIVPEFGNESIRELIEGNYRIVYRIKDKQIEIARIHHSARLLKSL